MKPLLALFDVDGTLFLTHDPLSSEALLATLRELYPVDPPGDAVERIDHEGQTAKRIARLVLRAEGLADEAIDSHLDGWCGRFAARYLELLAGADTSGWQVTPGASECLARLAAAGVRLALLTGNPGLWHAHGWNAWASTVSSRPARARSAATPSHGSS